MPRSCQVLGPIVALLGGLVLAPALHAEEPFDYFRNSWNVIGLKDYNFGTRVSPDNRLLLSGKSSMEFRVGTRLTPLGVRPIKQLLEGWLPIIVLTTREGSVRYDLTLWAAPLPTVKDWHKAYAWPTEGENYMNWVQVRATNTGSTTAEAKFQAVLSGSGKQNQKVSGATLAPGASTQFQECTPFMPLGSDSGFAPTSDDARLWLERTRDYWKGLLANACRIQVPCTKATEALQAAHVCQLIASDHGQLHGGEGFYDEFYIRDGAYQLMELEEAGLTEASARAVAYYLQAQRPDGRFETQQNQYDANGQALWVLWQYYRITGDRAWLKKAYPQMLKAVDWIKRSRRQCGGFPVCRSATGRARRWRVSLGREAPHRRLRSLEPARSALHTSRGPGPAAPGVERPGRGICRVPPGFRCGLSPHRPGSLAAQLGKRRHPLGQHRDAVAGARAAAG